MANGQISVLSSELDSVSVGLVFLGDDRYAVTIRVGSELISIHLTTEQLGKFTSQAGAL